jgi:hypothetical protein
MFALDMQKHECLNDNTTFSYKCHDKSSYEIILCATEIRFLYFFFLFHSYVILRSFVIVLCYFTTLALTRRHFSFNFSKLLYSLSSSCPHFLHSLPFILFSLFLRGGRAKL